MDKFDLAAKLRSLANEVESGLVEDNKGGPVGEQVIKSFKHLKPFGVMIGHRIDDKRTQEVNNGSALAVGENHRFNLTPILADGSEATGNDPRLQDPKFFKQDDDNNGKSPIIEYTWGSGNQEFSNSGNDPFHLNSYEDNAGCTPNLKLTRPIGPGRHKVWIKAFVRPQYNGGVGVESQTYEFYAD